MKKDKNKGAQKAGTNYISIVHSSAAEYLTFVASGGNSETSVEMRFENENIWLTQKMMAALYEVTVSAINQHLKHFFAAVQNKMHYAIHGNTPAEVIVDRSDHRIAKARSSKIGILMKFANTLAAHSFGIINCYPISTAVRTNNKIKTLQKSAYGFIDESF